MKTLASGGMMLAKACGRTTSRSVWRERHADRPRGLGLAGGDRVDARADRLGDERRRVERQRDDREPVEGRASDVDLGQPEDDEEEDHRERGVADEVDVERAGPAEAAGRARRAWRR